MNPAALTITASDQSKVYGTTANLGTTGFTDTGLSPQRRHRHRRHPHQPRCGRHRHGPRRSVHDHPSAAVGTGLSNYTITYDNAPIGLTVTPAALTITANDQSKVYGTIAHLGTTAFTETGLVNSDAITGVALTVPGSPSTATVLAALRDHASAAVGSGLSNYTITYDNAPTGLTVNPATLTITANDQSKIYGTVANLGTTAFTETGLVTANGDTVTGVTLTSPGSGATATVLGGPYAITPSAAAGTGLSNYTIVYDNAPIGLTVNPAALTITASDQSKTYGTIANLGTTGFTDTGLLQQRHRHRRHPDKLGVGSVRHGRWADRTPITPSAAVGSGLSNYTITYDNAPTGLTVNPAALTITASDQSKIYGTVANLGTTAFTETGLVTANGDAISGVTLDQLGIGRHGHGPGRALRHHPVRRRRNGPLQLHDHLRQRPDRPDGEPGDPDHHGQRPVQDLRDRRQPRHDRLHRDRPRHRQWRHRHRRHPHQLRNRRRRHGRWAGRTRSPLPPPPARASSTTPSSTTPPRSA